MHLYVTIEFHKITEVRKTFSPKGFSDFFLVMKSHSVHFQIKLIFMCWKIQGMYSHSYTSLIMQNKETPQINVLFFNTMTYAVIRGHIFYVMYAPSIEPMLHMVQYCV